MPPENGSNVAILYYLWINIFFWTIKDIVNNILEKYDPFTFYFQPKKIAKKRFILDFYSGITP